MENKELTAERSLEIISEQIAQSRKAVSKSVGTSLYVSGLCTAGMAVLIGILNCLAGNGAWHLLWFLLPVIIWLAEKSILGNKPATPRTFVGDMVGKTWWTFAVFVLGFFLFSILFNMVIRLDGPEVFVRLHISPLRIILLLMGMAVTITGHILKQKWLVWCGIIGGLGGFAWESFNVTLTLLARFGMSVDQYSFMQLISPSILIVLFSIVGLILPGYKIKK
ncbi:MAG: hypothetical protein K6C10_00210 [Prevotella sp.]|nr:hypothetical protein [Prevotella sp.]